MLLYLLPIGCCVVVFFNLLYCNHYTLYYFSYAVLALAVIIIYRTVVIIYLFPRHILFAAWVEGGGGMTKGKQ